MEIHAPLPGFQRLMAVCQRHTLPLRVSPALASAPKEGERIFGEPLDPQLAAVYQQIGEAQFGPFALYRPGDEWMDLIPWNTRLKEQGVVHYDASLIFAQETGFPIYLGTVPRLADPQGFQPVVYIHGSVSQYAIPLASRVDRFFDLCSSYLELMAVDPEYLESGNPSVVFPWDMLPQIVQDEALVAQVREGRFDFLANDQPDALGWLQRLGAPAD